MSRVVHLPKQSSDVDFIQHKDVLADSDEVRPNNNIMMKVFGLSTPTECWLYLREDVYDWLTNNVLEWELKTYRRVGRVETYRILFKLPEDAVKFKLRWL